ncbi:MAG: recombinase family protein [Chitinophagaceae bacterium]
MKAGYIRVSTEDQNPRLQEDCIKAYGVDLVFKDIDSGMNDERRAYTKLIESIERGEIEEVVVYRIDRLGRNPIELVSFFWNVLDKYLVEINSLMEPFANSWNRSSWAFRATWDAIGDARYELLRLKERQRAGIDAKKEAVRNGKATWKGRGKDLIPRGKHNGPGPRKKNER